MHKLIIRNIKQVVQVCESKELLRFGKDQMRNLAILNAEDTTNGFSVVVNAHGIIEDIGETGEIDSKYFSISFEKEIDASGQCLIPGKMLEENDDNNNAFFLPYFWHVKSTLFIL